MRTLRNQPTNQTKSLIMIKSVSWGPVSSIQPYLLLFFSSSFSMCLIFLMPLQYKDSLLTRTLRNQPNKEPMCLICFISVCSFFLFTTLIFQENACVWNKMPHKIFFFFVFVFFKHHQRFNPNILRKQVKGSKVGSFVVPCYSINRISLFLKWPK